MNWPLNQPMEPNGSDDPVCVAHLRWFPCLTPEHRYDSTNRTCGVVRDHYCAEILRRFHSGHIDRGALRHLLTQATLHGVPVQNVPVEKEIA